MINCAIYPRKSKAVDNSDSMDTQIDMCVRYLDDKYGSGNYTYTIYDGDYGITGHSTKNRKDFLRMMDAVRAGQIQLVVIQRYDRIARNVRDFCNLYHDMEQAGCALISVSQQIDTTTPYGKNFMYMQASMAELEWALNSERRKDAIRYANSIGKCTFSDTHVPWGYKAAMVDGIRRMVKDPAKEDWVKFIFEDYALYHNCIKITKTLNGNGFNFEPSYVRRIIRSRIYLGEYRGNKTFCEPYVTEELWNSCNIKKPVIRYDNKKQTEILFSGILICPKCGRKMRAQAKTKPNRPTYRYYVCEFHHCMKSCSFNKCKSELLIEKELIAYIDAFLAEYEASAQANTVQKKSNKDKISEVEKELERLNTMFQKGRITEEKYDAEYSRLEQQKALYETQDDSESSIQKAVSSFDESWKDIYNNLDRLHQKLFWRGIIDKILLDEDAHVKDVIFL